MNQENQSRFFAALTINRFFSDGVLNPETREATIKGGYMGQDFELDKIDWEVMGAIGRTEKISEFASEYIRLLAEKRQAP